VATGITDNLTNQVFGDLTVLERDYETQKKKKSKPVWLCRCICGEKISVIGHSLKNNRKTSCGCKRNNNKLDSSGKGFSKLINLSGQKFGKLTVIERDIDTQVKRNQLKPYWRCICECGVETSVNGSNLTRGGTSSCGCKRRENEKLILMRTLNENSTEKFKLIPLTMEIFAKVDNEDYLYLKNHTWRIDGAGYASTSVQIDGKWVAIMMQRMIMKISDDKVVKFLEKDSHDYRRSNLVAVERSHLVYNNAKTNKEKTSIYKGVHWFLGEWVSVIVKEGRRYPLGSFDSEMEAARAYNKKAIEFFGEHAWLNEVGDSST